MIRSWLVYLATLVSLVVFMIMYIKQSALVVCVMAAIVPLVYAVVTYVAARRGVSAYFEDDVLAVSRDEEAHIQVAVNNRSGLVSGCRAVVFLDIAGGMGNGSERRKKKFRLEEGENIIRFSYVAKYSGMNKVIIQKLRVYSGFSLLFHTDRPDAEVSFLIMPDYKEFPICQDIFTEEREGEGERFSFRKAGNDPSELFDIRQYRPGDKMNRINWKFSAKNHDLMVQDYGFPIACDTALFIDIWGEDDADTVERAIEILYYLVVRFVMEENLFYVLWKDAKEGCVMRKIIRREEDVFFLFSELFHSDMAVCPGNIESLYQAQFEGEFLTESVLVYAGRAGVEKEMIQSQLSTDYLELVDASGI